jgi:hypothetical protein
MDQDRARMKSMPTDFNLSFSFTFSLYGPVLEPHEAS